MKSWLKSILLSAIETGFTMFDKFMFFLGLGLSAFIQFLSSGLLLEKNICARDIMTRKAFENAMTVVMAMGGSTNAVLHYLAIARAALAGLLIVLRSTP